MTKMITLETMTLQQAYIIKHALRDKNRDEAEERLLQSVTEQIERRKLEK